MYVNLHCLGNGKDPDVMKMVMQKHIILLNQKFTTDKYTTQAIDSVTSTINDWFNQADYGTYAKLEQILFDYNK